jgi:hypothetical protein
MTEVDDLVEPRLEQIVLACLAPFPWLHPSPPIRCESRSEPQQIAGLFCKKSGRQPRSSCKQIYPNTAQA